MSAPQDMPPVGATVVDAVGVTYTLVADEHGNGAWEYGRGGVAHWSQEPILVALWRSEQARQAAEPKLAAIDAACLEVCRDNDPVTVGAGNVDPDAGRYLCIGESGDSVIDEDDPAEVIRKLSRVWERMQERAERAEFENTPGQRRRIEALEWAIVRTLYAGDIDPPNPAAPFWFREQLLRDSGLTMERCRALMDLHRGEDRVARL